MSVEINAVIICDGCGERIQGKTQTRTTRGVESYWDAKDQAKKRRWVEALRYGASRHYCDKCADGVTIECNKV